LGIKCPMRMIGPTGIKVVKSTYNILIKALKTKDHIAIQHILTNKINSLEKY
jgi:hypothetical protein